MTNFLKVIWRRATGGRLPELPEIERFGSDGEEAIYRLLCKHFDCVIRNVLVPHKNNYLEKDFMVVESGVPFIIEVKNWKGEITAEGDCFFQNKENGVRKQLKSPVGTTNQFIQTMKHFYQTERQIFGMVVFAEPNCVLHVPHEMEGIALLAATEAVKFIKDTAKANKEGQTEFDADVILHCTRFYNQNREFCKGLLADHFIDCYNKDGTCHELDTTHVKYLSVEHEWMRLRDKLYVTYLDGSNEVLYNRDCILTVGCLDGSYGKVGLNRIRHVVF